MALECGSLFLVDFSFTGKLVRKSNELLFMGMWAYQDVYRYKFEERLEFVQSIFVRLGAEPVNYYVTPRIPYDGNVVYEAAMRQRKIYHYKNVFIRVREVLFPDKPYIAIEWADNIEQINRNRMERYEPFPYDWSDSKIIEEVIHKLIKL